MTDYDTLRLPRLLDTEAADALLGEKVPDPAGTTIVKHPTIVRDADTEELVAIYSPLDNAGALRRAVLNVPMTGVQRSAAFRSRSRTFGAAPRKPAFRRDGCRMTAFYSDEPERSRVLEQFATQLGHQLAAVAPEVPDADRATLSIVKPEWRMGEEELWTSGVINQSAQLPYHRDNFNFRTWSAMPVVRRGMTGGMLSLPEYGLTLACADSTVSYFCGRQWVHGVTPMTKRTDDGYRYSVVYYALRGMKDCATHAEEQAMAVEKRTVREREMAKRLAAGDRSIPGSAGLTRSNVKPRTPAPPS